MARHRVKINSAGARALLRSVEVLEFVEAEARRRAAAAGPGYESSGHIGGRRARAVIETVSSEAIEDNARNNTLLRVL